jgi:enamidase
MRRLLRAFGLFVLLSFVGTGATVLALFATRYPGQPRRQEALAITGAELFDGTDRPPIAGQTIVVQGSTIACVGSACAIPAGAQVIDARGLAVLPGLIDLHVHVGGPVGDELEGFGMARFMADSILRSRATARRALLEAGITTVRSVGDAVELTGGLRVELREGRLAGPRLFAVGPMFTAPGGHPAGTIFKDSPWLAEHATRQVTDPEEARKEVRRLAAAGFEGVKAILTDGGRPGWLPRLSPDVLRAIVEEAHAHGMWAAVHTDSPEEVEMALEVAADSIEHGGTNRLLPDDLVQRLVAKSTTYVPTLAAFEADATHPAPYLEAFHLPWPEWLAIAKQNASAVARAGGRIGVGTDTQGPAMAFGGSYYRELELLVEVGLSPADAMRAATREGARALNRPQLGTLEPGKQADLILVAGRPWERISEIRKIRGVVQAGRVIVDAR